MADLDNLLGSRISLITIQDIRYDGVLFSINAAESSIVVRDGTFNATGNFFCIRNMIEFVLDPYPDFLFF